MEYEHRCSLSNKNNCILRFWDIFLNYKRRIDFETGVARCPRCGEYLQLPEKFLRLHSSGTKHAYSIYSTIFFCFTFAHIVACLDLSIKKFAGPVVLISAVLALFLGRIQDTAALLSREWAPLSENEFYEKMYAYNYPSIMDNKHQRSWELFCTSLMLIRLLWL